jgi:hypothetical protein
MKIEITKEEENLFNLLGRGDNGRVMLGYSEKLVKELADIRNIDTKSDLAVEMVARERAIKMIEENFVDRLKSFANKKELNEPQSEWH